MGKLIEREFHGKKATMIFIDESSNLSPAEWDRELIRLHVERENRLAAGKSSPTGWPMQRVAKPEDGIEIPRKPLKLNPPVLPPKSVDWLDVESPVDGDFLTMDDPWWLLAAYGLTITAAVVFIVLYFMGVI